MLDRPDRQIEDELDPFSDSVKKHLAHVSVYCMHMKAHEKH